MNDDAHILADTILAQQAERRHERRRKVLKTGLAAFNNGNSSYECQVRDLSETGAKLAFGDYALVPNDFSLLIRGEAKAHKAHVMWRAARALGVRLG